VRAAVILSSGFGEVDADGARRRPTAGHGARGRAAPGRAQLHGRVLRAGQLNGTYFWDLPRAAGGISIVSQSGAYGG
jgi:acyl-CoA synthetase (NDP forming)